MEAGLLKLLEEMGMLKENIDKQYLLEYEKIIDNYEKEIECYQLVDKDSKNDYNLIEISKVKEISLKYMKEIYNIREKLY